MEQQACFDQSDVFAFLADPATHELREPIIRIDTHGAAPMGSSLARVFYKVSQKLPRPRRPRAEKNRRVVAKAAFSDNYSLFRENISQIQQIISLFRCVGNSFVTS